MREQIGRILLRMSQIIWKENIDVVGNLEYFIVFSLPKANCKLLAE